MTESQRKNAESQRKTPDREKVINGLECCSSGGCYDLCCPYNDPEEDNCVGCTSKLAADALALLREQEPVKPVVDARDGWYRCGECGYTLHRINYDGSDKELRHEWFRFCPSCGKAVKWND